MNAAKRNTAGWLYLRVSGVAVLLLALGHLYIMHVANSVDTINDEFVRRRLASPLWKGYDFLLLSLALSHGSIGVKNVLEDIIRRPSLLTAAKIILGLMSAGLFLLGLAVFIKQI
ncbi:MAG: succinate dehydrogenase [Elusimicrobia bacterium]|nr:succinate dehydrogenase [Elusimicrobiota bacterium]